MDWQKHFTQITEKLHDVKVEPFQFCWLNRKTEFFLNQHNSFNRMFPMFMPCSYTFNGPCSLSHLPLTANYLRKNDVIVAIVIINIQFVSNQMVSPLKFNRMMMVSSQSLQNYTTYTIIFYTCLNANRIFSHPQNVLFYVCLTTKLLLLLLLPKFCEPSNILQQFVWSVSVCKRCENMNKIDSALSLESMHATNECVYVSDIDLELAFKRSSFMKHRISFSIRMRVTIWFNPSKSGFQCKRLFFCWCCSLLILLMHSITKSPFY